MSRYFEQFFADAPMVEIDEATARRLGTFVEELASPRRFRSVFRQHVVSVIYPDCNDPTEALADIRRLREGVPAEIYSPVEYGNVSRRWRTWYVDADGDVERIVKPEFDENGRYLRESYHGTDGELRGYMTYDYNDRGELIEVVEHAADGTITNRHD